MTAGKAIEDAIPNLKPRFSACQKGRPAPAAELSDAKADSAHIMEVYLRLAHSTEHVDATRLFTVQNNPRLWFGLDGDRGTPESIRDPIAQQLNSAEPVPPPTSFELAGDRKSIVATWTLKGPGQQPIGSYAVTFRKNAGRWAFARLEMIPPDIAVEPARPFCHLPGDVEAAIEVMANMRAEKIKPR